MDRGTWQATAYGVTELDTTERLSTEHLCCFLTPGPFSLSLQFTLMGVFAKIPEPAVAVDAISIAPCGGERGSENRGRG